VRGGERATEVPGVRVEQTIEALEEAPADLFGAVGKHRESFADALGHVPRWGQAEDQRAPSPDEAVGLADGIGIQVVVKIEHDDIKRAAESLRQLSRAHMHGAVLSGLGDPEDGLSREVLDALERLEPRRPRVASKDQASAVAGVDARRHAFTPMREGRRAVRAGQRVEGSTTGVRWRFTPLGTSWR